MQEKSFCLTSIIFFLHCRVKNDFLNLSSLTPFHYLSNPQTSSALLKHILPLSITGVKRTKRWFMNRRNISRSLMRKKTPHSLALLTSLFLSVSYFLLKRWLPDSVFSSSLSRRSTQKLEYLTLSTFNFKLFILFNFSSTVIFLMTKNMEHNQKMGLKDWNFSEHTAIQKYNEANNLQCSTFWLWRVQVCRWVVFTFCPFLA